MKKLLTMLIMAGCVIIGMACSSKTDNSHSSSAQPATSFEIKK